MKHAVLILSTLAFLACDPEGDVHAHRCVPITEYKEASIPCEYDYQCPVSPDLCQRVFCDWDNTCAALVPFEGEEIGCGAGMMCAADGCCEASPDAEVAQ